MRTPRTRRHRIGRIARSRPADLRDPIEVDLPETVPHEPVTGGPLTKRAIEELDPPVLRGAEEAREDRAQPRASRAGRRAIMLACWAALGFAATIVLSVTVPTAFGLRDLTVLSGSMEPTIHTGDVVVERGISPLDVRLGDVVSFKDPEDPSILITHRVQGMAVHDGAVSFVTKGDANTGVERWRVSADGTIGKVEYHVWRLGYLLSWIRGRVGRILLVVVPALLLGVYELIRIWRPTRSDDLEEREPDEAPA